MFNSFPVWYNDFYATVYLKCGEILYLVRPTQRVGQNRRVAEQNILGSNIVWNLKHLSYVTFVKTTYLDRKNIVALASRYELDGQWIKSAWRRDIPHPIGCPWGPTNPLYKGYRIPFLGVKRSGRDTERGVLQRELRHSLTITCSYLQSIQYFIDPSGHKE